MKKTTLIPVLILGASAFVLGILFATAGANFAGSGDRITADSYATPAILPRAAERSDLEQTFIDVAEAVNPAVVQIRTRGRTPDATRNDPFAETPFEGLFPYLDPQRSGIGSGIIVDPDGYVVTNHHVVANAADLDVMLYGGRVVEAQVVGSDNFFDLAVLKIEADGLPTIPFGSEDDIRVGQWVMAFGSPLSEDLNNTVTAGIVSGLGRISSLNRGSALIQTDAAINPGNSGGPLVDLQGRLIGINTLIASRTGMYNGIGFAVPAGAVINAIDQLKTTGRIRRGFLGVGFDRIPRPLVEALGVPPGAAQVTSVYPGTGAEREGIREGDIITGINGKKLKDSSHLRTTISSHRPGDEITLEVVRNQETQEYSIRLGDIPPELLGAAPATPSPDDTGSSFRELGLTLEEFDPEWAREHYNLADAPDFDGVLIVKIDPNSDARREALLQRFDVIIEANQHPVRRVRDLKRAYDDTKDGQTMRLTVRRQITEDGGDYVMFQTALKKPE